MARIFARIRSRQQNWLDATGGSTLHETCLSVWRRMIRPDALSWFQLFFEAYGQALQQPKEHKDFLKSVSKDWIRRLNQSFEQSGCGSELAVTISTVILAGFRGFMLDYCATRDRARIEKALEYWANALDAQLSVSLEDNR